MELKISMIDEIGSQATHYSYFERIGKIDIYYHNQSVFIGGPDRMVIPKKDNLIPIRVE